MHRKTTKNTIDKDLPVADVDEYLAKLPQATREALEKLRKAIKSAAPQAEEKISYRIPTYKHHGPLVHFAAHQNHCGFTAISLSVLQMFQRELEPYEISGRTIHFTADHPLPSMLVKKIVKARIKENETAVKKALPLE